MRKMSIAIALVVFATFNVFAVIPGANDPKAYTQNDYVRDVLDMQRRTSVEIYKAAGKHSDKWDAKAIEALDGLSLIFANAGQRQRTKMAEVPEYEKVAAAAKAAIDAG
jgi:hypothetical protein